MAKTKPTAEAFDALYETVDSGTGEYLEWSWDDTYRRLTAMDSKGNWYYLVPLTGEMEVETSDEEDEDVEEDEDY